MNPDDGGIGSRADSAIAVARETPGMVAMCVGCVGGGGGAGVVEPAKAPFRHQIQPGQRKGRSIEDQSQREQRVKGFPSQPRLPQYLGEYSATGSYIVAT